ncbi:flagellar hook-basal body complex protein [Limobrevibacterium gyesilva]|uniref:Flagellar hook-basal body complex protein n=1 Tax=Limobrevibacterium gyesilva TaxID=2991712 RepID=A0AA42CHQ1_9PROT|nr:flagellar hook-basal body complex protein [Limobrevibacterium gyesilva]MCW3475115.1 flagellar hook-basal body complex protein [Limobrevibacterium gyesilva]
MQNITTIALSRLVAQQRALDVTATNIANAGTPGFHAERMLFSDWLMRQPAPGLPPGGRVMAYTQDRATYRDTQSGPLTHTGNPLDLAVGADGFFTVQTPRGPRLTRSGHYELSNAGTVVDNEGDALLDVNGRPIQVSTADAALSVTADGTISSENGRIGRIGVVMPDDPQKLKAEGSRQFNADVPTRPVAAPKVIQGAIEESNVKPTVELARMMNDLREFQFASQMVQSEADREQAAIDKITQKRL